MSKTKYNELLDIMVKSGNKEYGTILLEDICNIFCEHINFSDNLTGGICNDCGLEVDNE